LLTLDCYLAGVSDSLAIHPVRLPTVSYAPFRLLEAVPWLMFATAMRILESRGGVQAIFAAICAGLAVFLAFLLAARRMIELTDGRTGLGKLDFAEQLVLARKVMFPVLLFMAATAFVVVVSGARWTGMHLLVGFDGIAFDQITYLGMMWSALLATTTLLLLLKVESGGGAGLTDVFKELWRRSACMVPAIVAITVAHIGLSALQGAVRIGVYVYWHSTTTPHLGQKLVYFFFIFGFASVRLWITLAILVLALRESYRRGHGAPALPEAGD
jgi:hypothetical protein